MTFFERKDHEGVVCIREEGDCSCHQSVLEKVILRSDIELAEGISEVVNGRIL